MKILVHDYVGHPFEVQLSRGLAARGHEVLHVYSAAFVTPRGELEIQPDDPVSLSIRGLSLSSEVKKNNFVQRFWRETEFAGKLIDQVVEFEPDLVLSANAPSIVQFKLLKALRRRNVPLVSWVQDLYGVAAYRLLGRRIPGIGHLVGKYFMYLDQWVIRNSAAVVCITEDFEPLMSKWRGSNANVFTVHNWAPLDSLPERPRDNSWATEQQLTSGFRFIYSGTLAMKHNPELLLALGKMLAERSDRELLIISQGAGVDWIKRQMTQVNAAIRVLDFQHFSLMPDVFGSADVLVAILEPDAGIFSVPSKVLSYLCAGRPVLAAIPSENLAARIIHENGAGLTACPRQTDEFVTAARQLIESEELRSRCSRNAREYAERHFDFKVICDKFEDIVHAATCDSVSVCSTT